MVPYDRPHVMEGVVGILLTARKLLDAAQRRIVGEHMLVVPTNWPPKGASRFGIVGESIIKNFLDICVVSLGVTARVEIRGHGIFSSTSTYACALQRKIVFARSIRRDN